MACVEKRPYNVMLLTRSKALSNLIDYKGLQISNSRINLAIITGSIALRMSVHLIRNYITTVVGFDSMKILDLEGRIPVRTLFKV